MDRGAAAAGTWCRRSRLFWRPRWREGASQGDKHDARARTHSAFTCGEYYFARVPATRVYAEAATRPGPVTATRYSLVASRYKKIVHTGRRKPETANR